MRVQHRAIVALCRGRPVARQRAACVPILGDVRESDAGPLLAQLATPSVDQDLLQQRLGIALAQKALRRAPPARPGLAEALLVLACLVAPPRTPRLSTLALVKPEVTTDGSGEVEGLRR